MLAFKAPDDALAEACEHTHTHTHTLKLTQAETELSPFFSTTAIRDVSLGKKGGKKKQMSRTD